jgi:hypothetical protein
VAKRLEAARIAIEPPIGASTYTMTRQAIALRNDLTVDKVAVTNDIDECLTTALEEMLRLVDLKWLREDDSDKHRLSEIKTGEPLSLVKDLRRRSESPQIHRSLQTLRVVVDYIEEHPAYDHFAGALLVPQLASLGSIIAVLRQVPGVAERLSALWRGPSSGSDAVAYELLVAATRTTTQALLSSAQPPAEAVQAGASLRCCTRRGEPARPDAPSSRADLRVARAPMGP